MHRNIHCQSVLALVSLLLWTAACNPASLETVSTPIQAPSSSETQTLENPTSTVSPTSAPTSSNTPQPTASPTLTQTALPTDTPNPTETPDIAATQAVEQERFLEAVQTDAIRVLSDIGMLPQSGKIIWAQETPIILSIDSGNNLIMEKIGDDISLNNFILKADINWTSDMGFSGCGLLFRSTGDEELKLQDQYRFYTIRMEGLPLWDIELYRDNIWATTLGGRARSNKAIEQENGWTNTYILKAEKDLFVAYANYARLSQLQSTALTGPGRFGVFAFQESGSTTCILTDAWIWSLDED